MNVSERDLVEVREASATLVSLADAAELPHRTLAAVAGVVESDVITYNLVTAEPDHVAYLVEPDHVALDGDAFAAHMHEHPLIQRSRRARSPQCLRIADLLSRRSFHRLGIYSEFFRPAGLEEQMALSIGAGGGAVVGIALNRSRGRFSERERLLLGLLGPALLASRRSLNLRSVAAAALAAEEIQGERSGVGVILLGGSGRPQLRTRRARELLARFEGRSHGSEARLPARLEEWVRWRRLRGDAAAGAGGSAVLLRGERATLRVEYLAADETGRPAALLLSEPSRHAAAEALTPRQRQVFALLARGLGDATIATELGLSARTVQKHLERGYRVLGVSSRTAAIALLLGP